MSFSRAAVTLSEDQGPSKWYQPALWETSIDSGSRYQPVLCEITSAIDSGRRYQPVLFEYFVR